MKSTGKTQVLIIEDCDYKSFTTKQVLEAQLKLEVNVVPFAACIGQDLLKRTEELQPDVIVFRPEGGVAELLQTMKKRRANRRNTEVTVLVADDLDDKLVRQVKRWLDERSARVATAA